MSDPELAENERYWKEEMMKYYLSPLLTQVQKCVEQALVVQVSVIRGSRRRRCT